MGRIRREIPQVGRRSFASGPLVAPACHGDSSPVRAALWGFFQLGTEIYSNASMQQRLRNVFRPSPFIAELAGKIVTALTELGRPVVAIYCGPAQTSKGISAISAWLRDIWDTMAARPMLTPKLIICSGRTNDTLIAPTLRDFESATTVATMLQQYAGGAEFLAGTAAFTDEQLLHAVELAVSGSAETSGA